MSKLPKSLVLSSVILLSILVLSPAGIADEERRIYGLQFHPEVTHTKQGEAIYQRFLHEICGCGSAWNPHNIVGATIANVRQQVGDGHVILGLSGGVDSSVVAALLHEADVAANQ